MLAEIRADTQTVLIDGAAGYSLALGEGALRVQRFDEPARVLPLRRIGRVLLRQPRSADLCALLELASRGVPIHFQDGYGRIAATLVSTEPEPAPQVRQLLDRIESGNPRPAYAEWRDLQLRHAASRILRQAPRGTIERFECKLACYAARGIEARQFDQTCNEVRALCYALIDGELTRARLRRVADALTQRECPLLHDLDRALTIPLLWNLGPWLRQHRRHDPRQRMDFFESVRDKLDRRLTLALAALHYHLDAPRPAQAPRKSGPRHRHCSDARRNRDA